MPSQQLPLARSLLIKSFPLFLPSQLKNVNLNLAAAHTQSSRSEFTRFDEHILYNQGLISELMFQAPQIKQLICASLPPFRLSRVRSYSPQHAKIGHADN